VDRIKAVIEGTQWLPFFLTAGTHPTLSPARLIESVIIAAMAGGMSVWATTLVIQKDIEHIKSSQVVATEWYRDTQDQLRELEKYVYTQNHGGKSK